MNATSETPNPAALPHPTSQSGTHTAIGPTATGRPSQRRTKRTPRQKDRTVNNCARPGCARDATPGHHYCCLQCRLCVKEHQSAQRVHDRIGDYPDAVAYITATEAFTAAWNDVIEARHTLYRIARDAGWTLNRWQRLLDGKPTTEDTK
jgi:hypothetical protein